MVALSPPARRTPDLNALESACREIGNFLEGIRSSVDTEIRTYPTPIPRCDAQFNHLYEQRSRVCAQLALISETRGGVDKSHALCRRIKDFVDAAPYDNGVEEQALKQRFAAMLCTLYFLSPE